jgi:crossover junction endodeoxyribonuclease RusA
MGGIGSPIVLPVEFIVIGTPISHQSHNKERLRAWGEAVAQQARNALPAAAQPTEVRIEVQVVYYFQSGPTLPDEDNLLKPIQDAMRGLVYVDDDQVMDGAASKRDIDGAFKVRRMSPVLARGFVRGDEFVHVIVREAPDPTRLRS